MAFFQKLPALDARRRQSGRSHLRVFPIECRVTRDELARVDALAVELGVSRWRVMRLDLHMMFEQEQRTNAAREGRAA